MKEAIVLVAIFGVIFGLPIWGAFALNKRLHIRNPSAKPFAWGYWIGISAFLAPLFILSSVNQQMPDMTIATKGMIFFGLMIVYVPLGFKAMGRNKSALTWITILSFNPLLWIVNYIYLRNRWDEFDSLEKPQVTEGDFISISTNTRTGGAPNFEELSDSSKTRDVTPRKTHKFARASAIAIALGVLAWGTYEFRNRERASDEVSHTEVGAPPAIISAKTEYAKFAGLLKLAESGDLSAQSEIARRYYEGDGIERNFQEAAKWTMEGAKRGIPKSQNNLGTLYQNGEGVTQNHKEAVNWYRLAAAQGYGPAQYNLANRYAEGTGVPQDFKAAVALYRLAAEKGLPEAQYALAQAYERGLGVTRNRTVAYAISNLAAVGDSSPEGDATKFREGVASKMSGGDIEIGQKLTREMAQPGNLLVTLDRFIGVSSKRSGTGMKDGGKSVLDCERELGNRASDRTLVSACLAAAVEKK